MRRSHGFKRRISGRLKTPCSCSCSSAVPAAAAIDLPSRPRRSSWPSLVMGLTWRLEFSELDRRNEWCGRGNWHPSTGDNRSREFHSALPDYYLGTVHLVELPSGVVMADGGKKDKDRCARSEAGVSVLPRASTRQNHGACTRISSRGSSVCVESRAVRVVHSGPSSSSNSIAVKNTNFYTSNRMFRTHKRRAGTWRPAQLHHKATDGLKACCSRIPSRRARSLA